MVVTSAGHYSPTTEQSARARMRVINTGSRITLYNPSSYRTRCPRFTPCYILKSIALSIIVTAVYLNNVHSPKWNAFDRLFDQNVSEDTFAHLAIQ